jgi:hypothetical protein
MKEYNATDYPTHDKALIGAAGVHFVVSKLNLHGLIALPTIRNTAGIDIVVIDKEGTEHANIQVKTSRSKVGFWPISKNFKSWRGSKNYYAFVRYLKDSSEFEVFLESSDLVVDQVLEHLKEEHERGVKDWTPCWYLPKDQERLRNQWQEFEIKYK